MSDEGLENARIGYRAAIDLTHTSGSQNWSRFNSMLVANSVFFAVIGQVLADHISIDWPWQLVFPGAGLVLCVSWVAAVERGLVYQDYYVAKARELEARLGLDVIQQGDALSRGRGVPVGEDYLRIVGVARIRARHTMRMVILPFVLLYVLSAIALWWHR